MLTITKKAARQIRKSAADGDMEELALRIAPVRKPDGGVEYKMGFDEVRADDVMLSSAGVDVVIAEGDKLLLNGTVLDFVEYEPDDFRFIFMNPNDPDYRPPEE